MLLVDGRTDQLAFNRVQLGQLMQRDPSMVAPLWIIDPQAGTTSPHGQIAVYGRATTAGEQVFWQVSRADVKGEKTAPLASGHVDAAGAGPAQGQFRFTVNLPPGKYVVRVFSSDPGPGDASAAAWDSKDVTVEP
jgi:hypothetical protein